MTGIMHRLKHAFAVDPTGPAEPTPAQQPCVDWVCIQIARRRLTTPGLLFLEMSRPLNYLGSQVLHFMRPGIWALASSQTYEGYIEFSHYLEHRGSMEYLARRIEHFEDEFTRLEKSGGDLRQFIREHLETVHADAVAAKQVETEAQAARNANQEEV